MTFTLTYDPFVSDLGLPTRPPQPPRPHHVIHSLTCYPPDGTRAITLTSWGVWSSSGCPPPSHLPCPHGSPAPVESCGTGDRVTPHNLLAPGLRSLGPAPLLPWPPPALCISCSGFLGVCPHFSVSVSVSLTPVSPCFLVSVSSTMSIFSCLLLSLILSLSFSYCSALFMPLSLSCPPSVSASQSPSLLAFFLPSSQAQAPAPQYPPHLSVSPDICRL